MAKCYDNFSKEELIELLNKQDKELALKKYGLVWDTEKEPEKVVQDCQNNLPILKRVSEKEIKTDNSNYNILIEGDNFHALSVLNYTHKGNIDLIYIDPPYNKGENDFVYNDKFVNKDDGYLHSKWLNFMEKRLLLTKELLSNEGAIFISIDEDEHSNLKLLCDKVYGEQNFIGNLIWRKKYGGGQADEYFVTEHEYILVYAKNEKEFLWIDEQTEKDISKYNKIDENGNRFKLTKLEKWGNNARREDRPTMYFPILTPNGEEYYPKDPHGNDGRWRVGKIRMNYLITNNLIYWDNSNGKLIPKEIEYYNENSSEGDILKARSILYDIAETADGSNALTKIFGEKDKFNNPKPVELIKYILKHTAKKENSIILDFFAGSGSTAQAVMEYNSENDTDFRFIICTNNENLKATLKLQKDLNLKDAEFTMWKIDNNKDWEAFISKHGICTSVTYPRIKKVIQGYSYSGKDKKILYEKKLNYSSLKTASIENILSEIQDVIAENEQEYNIKKEFKNNTIKIIGSKDISGIHPGLQGNLQYFKTDFIKNSENIEQLKVNLTYKCTEMLCLKENIYNLKEEQEDYKIFESNKKDKYLCVYYNFINDSFEDFLSTLKKLEGQKIIYMFSMDDRIDNELFEEINNYKIETIPQKILDIYKKIIKENVRG